MPLHDNLEKDVFTLEDCHTDVQAADIFTKNTLFTAWSGRNVRD